MRLKRKLLATLLILAMILNVIPAIFAAAAEEDGPFRDDPLPPLEYVDANDNPKTQNAYEVLDDSTGILLRSSWYSLSDVIENESVYRVEGNVNIVLCDGAHFDVGAIVLQQGASLTIWWQGGKTGAINVYGESHHAGIEVQEGTTLTVNGGNIRALGDIAARESEARSTRIPEPSTSMAAQSRQSAERRMLRMAKAPARVSAAAAGEPAARSPSPAAMSPQGRRMKAARASAAARKETSQGIL